MTWARKAEVTARTIAVESMMAVVEQRMVLVVGKD